MKKMNFALIAVALFALCSAFVTKGTKTTQYKYHELSRFTYLGTDYVEVQNLTGLQEGFHYDCLAPDNSECTFEVTMYASDVNNKLAITKSAWDGRSNIGIGDFQPISHP
ncbi:MAG TPA: hypothetical protein VGQ09_12180 [Chitinophagaceae bacterium]|nr:hypothetical protein [Chitinophagaceae bacterium]